MGSRICYKEDPNIDGYMGSSKYLKEDYKIYGAENFTKKILKEDYSNVKDMLNGESFYMHEYNTFEPSGYNRYDPNRYPGFHMGGYHHSEETKIKMKGRIPWMKGKHHVKESKEKMYKSALERWKNPEEKKLQSQRLKGKKASRKTKEKMSKNTIGKKSRIRK